MSYVQTLIPIIDLGNQPVLVAFDSEHGPAVHCVRVCECLSYIQQILPRCLLRNSEPRIQRTFQLGMPRCRFFEPFSADHVHSGPKTRNSQSANIVVRIMRIVKNSCDALISHFRTQPMLLGVQRSLFFLLGNAADFWVRHPRSASILAKCPARSSWPRLSVIGAIRHFVRCRSALFRAYLAAATPVSSCRPAGASRSAINCRRWSRARLRWSFPL